jgi:hypothetical protein
MEATKTGKYISEERIFIAVATVMAIKKHDKVKTVGENRKIGHAEITKELRG